MNLDATLGPAEHTLREKLLFEIFRAMDILEHPWRKRLVRLLTHQPVKRFIGVTHSFDQTVAKRGFPQACRELLPLFVDRVRTFGAGLIPQHGPLIIASNHPGSVDALLLSSYLYRNDLRMVTRDMPYLRSMTALSPHFIYSTRDHVQRATVLRQGLRHLEQGGALILFPSGKLDPDPGVFAGASEAMEEWTESLNLFLRKVPQTQVVLAIISGIIGSRWLSHPFVRLQRGRWDQQFSAELLQTLSQVIFPRWYRTSPSVHFSGPVSTEELVEGDQASRRPDYRQALMLRARSLLEQTQNV